MAHTIYSNCMIMWRKLFKNVYYHDYHAHIRQRIGENCGILDSDYILLISRYCKSAFASVTNNRTWRFEFYCRSQSIQNIPFWVLYTRDCAPFSLPKENIKWKILNPDHDPTTKGSILFHKFELKNLFLKLHNYGEIPAYRNIDFVPYLNHREDPTSKTTLNCFRGFRWDVSVPLTKIEHKRIAPILAHIQEILCNNNSIFR